MDMWLLVRMPRGTLNVGEFSGAANGSSGKNRKKIAATTRSTVPRARASVKYPCLCGKHAHARLHLHDAESQKPPFETAQKNPPRAGFLRLPAAGCAMEAKVGIEPAYADLQSAA